MYLTSRDDVEFTVLNKNPKEIYFTSPYPSGYPDVDRAKALLYEIKNPKGALVFIHGSGSGNFSHLQYYTKNFSKNGYITMMPILPYHFGRIPKGCNSSSSFLKGNSSIMEKKFFQAVNDILTCIDYLEKLGIDNINIMGYSFGGMISTIVMALDDRLNKGILIVTGGNFEYIIWHSIATRVIRLNYEEDKSCNPERCHEIHKTFEEAAKRFNGIEELKKLPSCFRYDPSLFASLLNREKVLMFTALLDPFIPRKSSDDLWYRIGKPKRYFLLSGHMTAHIFFKRYILNKCLSFLDK